MARAIAVPTYWAEDQKQTVRIVPPRCRMNSCAASSGSKCCKLRQGPPISNTIT